jgi:hypothetical protein
VCSPWQEYGARTSRTADAKCVVAQYARTDFRKHSFAIRALESWDRLPNSIRADSRPERFKQRLSLIRPRGPVKHTIEISQKETLCLGLADNTMQADSASDKMNAHS